MRAALKGILQREGWEVSGLSSFEEAVRELSSREFNLVVTDYMLASEESGLSLLAHLRDAHKHTPAILTSGTRDSGLQLMARKLGAFGFLRKPFDSRVLLSVCREAAENCSDGGASSPPVFDESRDAWIGDR